MWSKNKAPITADERERVSLVKAMACVVCETAGPSDAHEPEQGLWFISMPLCRLCHTGKDGWHGTRLRWTLRKMTELKAINKTQKRLSEMSKIR